ncbi:MAG: ABC transporter ATP-binding protein [Gaiellales bacterium]
MPLLDVRDLRVSFRTLDGVVKAVDGVSFSLDRGRTIGLVGESGSGKSVLTLTLSGLTRSPTTEISGEIFFAGRDLAAEPTSELRPLRGKRIAMIFQDPLSSLHPFYRVGWQIGEAIGAHERASARARRTRAIELLRRVRIPDPAARVDAYPHELSGGMRQRVMIAMALALGPELLVADEPTTALDVTVQAQILELLADLQDEHGTAIVLISHDFGVVAELAHEIAVMYAGRIVERGSRDAILGAPEHPYTIGLLDSIPRLDAARGEELSPIPGFPPNLVDKIAGCAFGPRCRFAQTTCAEVTPPLVERGADHLSACLFERSSRSVMVER